MATAGNATAQVAEGRGIESAEVPDAQPGLGRNQKMVTVFSFYEGAKQLKELREELERGIIPCADFKRRHSLATPLIRARRKPGVIKTVAIGR
jgi:hypothetical protein